MQVTTLVQDLISQIVNQINNMNARDINIGDLLTARVKAVDGDNVLIRFQGQDILAKTMIPLEAGETINFQYQGVQQGKFVFKLIEGQSDKQKNDFLANILNAIQLPNNEDNREIARQIIRYQLPLDKKEITQIANSIKQAGISSEDIGEAVFLYKQGLPVTTKNTAVLKDFNSGELNIFKGIGLLKDFSQDNSPKSPELKAALENLLSKAENIEITMQDNKEQITAKLSAAFKWLTTPETMPDNLTEDVKVVILPYQNTREETTSAAVNNQPAMNGNDAQVANKSNNPIQANPENVINNSQNNNQANEQIDPKLLNQSTGKTIADNSQLSAKENIFNQLQHLADNSLNEPAKINAFLLKAKELLNDNSHDIKQTADTILKELANPKTPQESTVREVIRDFSDKLGFIENYIASAPNHTIDASQQVVYYSQSVIKGNNEQETPVNITIRRPRDREHQKIDFNNCTLMVSLNTIKLGLVTATVKKADRTLSCELAVADDAVSKILTPSLPLLAQNLENLNYQVNIKPVKVVQKGLAVPTTAQDEPINLFNIDIRI